MTLRVGMVVAQFHVNRHGLIPPVYLYDKNGWGDGHNVQAIDLLPASLQPEVTRLVRHYRTHYILKGDT